MRRMTIAALVAGLSLSLTLVACGQKQGATDAADQEQTTAEETVSEAEDTQAAEATDATATGESDATASQASANPLGTVSNTIAEDEDALVSTYAGAFTQETYTDADTGLSVTYNLYLPEGYDESASYPLVVFIADSSCAGGDASRSLTQGLGALVWASAEWQAWGVEGGIHLHGIKEHSSVEIINMLGQVVYRTSLEGTETYIPMKSGVYIVRGDNSAVKVFVK